MSCTGCMMAKSAGGQSMEEFEIAKVAKIQSMQNCDMIKK